MRSEVVHLDFELQESCQGCNKLYGAPLALLLSLLSEEQGPVTIGLKSFEVYYHLSLGKARCNEGAVEDAR